MPDDSRTMLVNQLRQEQGAHELSPDIEPYPNFAMAVMQDADATPKMEPPAGVEPA
jgi:hypothetical protein